jgi:AraC family transcriptional regulator
VENSITLTGPPVFFLHERSAEEAVKADYEGSADIDMAFSVPPGSCRDREYGGCFSPGGRELARIVHKILYVASGHVSQAIFSWSEWQGMRIT